MPFDNKYEYDVAISYASEDRDYAEAVAKALSRYGVKVFFDSYETNNVWGKNLYTHLSDVYQNKARYCIIFLSQHYASKQWTKHELEAAQARAFKENEEYILPIRLDNMAIPSILSTIAYLSWPPQTSETIAHAVITKLSKSGKALTHPQILTSRPSPSEQPVNTIDIIKNATEKNPLIQSMESKLFTVLDIGTAYVKAIIVEVHGNYAEVLGVGRHPQSYSNMSDGFVTDISGVIANCNEALVKAEQLAGGVVAPSAIIGVAGKLVKGSSTAVSVQRPQPSKVIAPEELDILITAAQKRLLKNAKERIASETGYENIEVRLTNAVLTSVRIDGQVVSNPIGFRGRHFIVTLFSAFAPLTQLGALEAVAQGLDLTLVTIVAKPYTLARCLSTNVSTDSGAIFIDVGAGTTDIALVRQGDIEEICTFTLGGRTFTRRIATSKGIAIKDAERLKISYSNGEIKGSSHDEIQAILAPECQTWIDSVELFIEELSKGKHLPPAIYTVGGGSALIDLRQKLESFPWTERLPFSRPPIIRTVLPEMVSCISDRDGLLINAQDITLMALAYQAIELQNENNVLEKALDRVINTMHI